ETVGDGVEDLAVGHLAQPVAVERRRRHLAALKEDPFAVAALVMAGAAIDVEALLPALPHRVVDRHRDRGDEGAARVLAGPERAAVAQLAAGDGARDRRPHGGAVVEE